MKQFLCACLVALAGLAVAQPTAASTLEKVRKSGTFTIGFRMDARPFSFLDADGQAAGYAVELCRRIAAATRGNLGLADMNVDYVPVKAANRIKMLESKEFDIECGSTTRTLQRQERVDVALLTFVTGAEMLMRVGSGIGDLPDLAGRKVGVLEGTTTERGLRNALEKRLIDAQVVTVERHGYGLTSSRWGTSTPTSPTGFSFSGWPDGPWAPRSYSFTGAYTPSSPMRSWSGAATTTCG